jgi:hypothetical protein
VPAAATPAPPPGGGGASGGTASHATVVRVRVVGAPRLGAALRHGLRVRVTAPAAGRVRITLARRGRTLATGASAPRAADPRVVTVRFTRHARHTLRRAHALSGMLTVAWRGAGHSATARLPVSLRR